MVVGAGVSIGVEDNSNIEVIVAPGSIAAAVVVVIVVIVACAAAVAALPIYVAAADRIMGCSVVVLSFILI